MSVNGRDRNGYSLVASTGATGPEARRLHNVLHLAERVQDTGGVHRRAFACGNRGVSEWTISGTTTEGERIEVRGCDLWTFGDDDRLTRKDSFWEICES